MERTLSSTSFSHLKFWGSHVDLSLNLLANFYSSKYKFWTVENLEEKHAIATVPCVDLP